MSDNLEDMDIAAEEDALEYLWLNHPSLARAVEKGMRLGETPENIKRRANKNFGPYRDALALRCYLAARYLQRAKQSA